MAVVLCACGMIEGRPPGGLCLFFLCTQNYIPHRHIRLVFLLLLKSSAGFEIKMCGHNPTCSTLASSLKSCGASRRLWRFARPTCVHPTHLFISTGARAWWAKAGKRVCRVALACALSLNPPGLFGLASYFCVVLPRSELCAKHR
jgi:hypothetical protein